MQPVLATLSAFAPILGDGLVVTWGRSLYDGDSSAVQAVQHVNASVVLVQFWAMGRQLPWSPLIRVVTAPQFKLNSGTGDPLYGCASSAVHNRFRNVRRVRRVQDVGATLAAISGDGPMFTWSPPRFWW